MEQTKPLTITISRQLGSGGAYIGQQLAKKLNIFYADREIISEAAKKLSILEEEFESRDEKISSFWKSYFQSYAFAAPDAYIPPQMMAPTDRELFNAEKQVIERIAKEHPAIIIGRCGSHILKDFPHHVSIFLHADLEFRKERAQKIYRLSEKTAEKMIAQNDKERSQYYKTFTGENWTDARRYALCLNTGKIGIDQSVELILNYLNWAGINSL